MPKESKNVDKSCAFSSLVRSYDHAINDKSKTTLVSDLVCGDFFITLELHSHVILGSTNKLSLI